MNSLDDDTLAEWLQHTPAAPAIHFADVAGRLAAWLRGGCRESVAQLSEAMWQNSVTGRDGAGAAAIKSECALQIPG